MRKACRETEKSLLIVLEIIMRLLMPYNFNGIESLFTPQCVYRLKHEKGKLKHRAKCDYTAAINGGLLLCIEKCNGNCDRFITHTHTRGQHDMKSN